MTEPNWLDPKEARAHKIVLVDMDSIPEGEHRFAVPFRPDDFDGMWRTVCSCGEVFGPLPDDGEVFREELTGASWPKVQGDLFDAARRHAYIATTGRDPYARHDVR